MVIEKLPTGSGPTPASPSPSVRPPRRSWRVRLKGSWWLYARWIIAVVPVLLLGFAVGAALYVSTHPNFYTGSEVLDRPAGAVGSFSWPLRLTHRVNVLLIGVDVTLNNKRQVVPISRSDTLMLIGFDPERNRISALSIPRDTRAAIPGVGVMKINAAYAFGGPSLTVKAVEQFLGVPIHSYVKLGPESFARIIDAVGGIDMDVEKDMKYKDWWGGINIDLKKGRQHLNGEQAMGYARFRHDVSGDIGRVGRQQKVLLALFAKLKSPSSVLSAPQIVRAFEEHTQTNLTLRELMTLGVFTARLSGSDLHLATLPGQISPSYWEPDLAKTRRMVAEMFFGVDSIMLASTAIEVLNASGVPGLARQTAQRLQQMGFRIVRVDNAPTIADKTTIIDRAGPPQVVRLLAEILGRTRITHEPGIGPDITVIVARDQARSYTAVLARAQR